MYGRYTEKKFGRSQGVLEVGIIKIIVYMYENITV